MLELELEQRTNIKLLVKLGKSGSKIREILVQVYRNNAMKKTAVYKWVTRYSEGRENVTGKERSGQPAERKKTLQNFFELCVKTSADCQDHSRAS
jgi:transposase